MRGSINCGLLGQVAHPLARRRHVGKTEMFMKLYKAYKDIGILLGILLYKNIAPILVSKDGKVVDGNSRLRVAKKLGIRMIPVVFMDANVIQIDPNDISESY